MSLVVPAMHKRSSSVVAVAGERVALDTVGRALSMVTVLEATGVPTSVPSVGVTVQRTTSPFTSVLLGMELPVIALVPLLIVHV